jgi:hypothetical protein
MKTNKYGRIVNVSSGAGSLHYMGPPYLRSTFAFDKRQSPIITNKKVGINKGTRLTRARRDLNLVDKRVHLLSNFKSIHNKIFYS